jgi:serine/threonine protein phosphatase PrpC
MLKKVIKAAYAGLQEKLERQTVFDVTASGSTLSQVFITRDLLMIANLGDSKAVVLGRESSTGNLSVMFESRDHKPTDSDE